MSDIIQLLPDSVANQIAAGEVIQRPASVVKELVENSIDAGASTVKVNIKDAGRTLIQIIDDGKGMSETDARMAFERHATSKIKSAEDIFAIRTMGFRGEALASIASIAQVELRTRQETDELGTVISINGSDIQRQEPISCAQGANFSIKNIFYNIPARRKFLKSNNTEFRYILDEFHRIVLSNPGVSFQLTHNDKDIYYLPKSNLKQRIVNIFGKQYDKNLLSIESDTSIIKIHGFIGLPDFAKKKNYEQFFFVNDRFMKHRSFYGAVMRAYEHLISPGSYPAFFIFLEIEPDQIDINIHPTKTEIKFTDEYHIGQILEATIRESLGKHNVVPSLDFEDDTDYNDIFSKPSGDIPSPSVSINTNYNPFESNSASTPQSTSKVNMFKPGSTPLEESNKQNWDNLFSISEDEFDSSSDDFETTTFESKINEEEFDDIEEQPQEKKEGLEQNKFFQIKSRYIATMVKSGLMLINQKRAHERILYEQYLDSLQNHTPASQMNLFPLTFEAHTYEAELMKEMIPDFKQLGFDIEEFGQNTFVINGTPSNLKSDNIVATLHELLHIYQENKTKMHMDAKENIAGSLAQASAIRYGQLLSQDEMRDLTDRLFACSMPNISATGKKTIVIIEYDDIAQKFNS